MEKMRMGKVQFEILGEQLAKMEAELTVDMNVALYPGGRQATYDRINAMCEVSPLTIGVGPISREPTTWWKTRKL